MEKTLVDSRVALDSGSQIASGHSLLSQTRGPIAIPPEEFIKLVCGDNGGDHFEEFRWAGRLITEILKDEQMILSDTHFLDVGCGCGRVARYLLDFPIKSYIGFDRHAGMIEWCRREITACAPSFRFHYFSIKSAYGSLDGQQGTIEACSFDFPFPEGSFSSALLASVFTHMPMEESRHYLKELYRVLKPEGKIFLSVFFTYGEPYRKGINFYYNSKEFLRGVREAGFLWKFRQGLHNHNCYVLTKV